MKIKTTATLLACLLGVVATQLVATQSLVAADDDAKPKHTIKEVMKIGHKDGLLKKVLGGDASDDEKKQLLDLYVSMVENRPSKGDMESWVKLAGGSVLAAAKVVTGREGSIAELKEATNCKACHSAHKGD